MADSTVDLALPILGRCLRVENAPDAVEALIEAMPGWPMTVHPPLATAPNAYLYRDKEGLWQGAFDEKNEYHLPSPASAACSLVGDLVSQRLSLEPELLGLHCASVEIDGRLVLFPENSKAGKSTLSVAFAAAGYRVFGDDVLGFTPQGEGVAMGVAPRLRLPLPDSFSKEFVRYATEHAGPEDERYRFVLPKASHFADYNERSPVGAIVLLERDPLVTEPEVVTLSASEGLLQLLCQNFARDTSGEALLERLLPLMRQVPCLLLRYSEPLTGARYLAQVMEQPQLTPTNSASLLNTPPTEIEIVEPEVNSVWQPATYISTYPLGEELFLIHTPSGTIHRLNSTGKLVWQLLQQEALSSLELSEVLASYFNAALETVLTDVQELIAAMAQTGLITAQP